MSELVSRFITGFGASIGDDSSSISIHVYDVNDREERFSPLQIRRDLTLAELVEQISAAAPSLGATPHLAIRDPYCDLTHDLFHLTLEQLSHGSNALHIAVLPFSMANTPMMGHVPQRPFTNAVRMQHEKSSEKKEYKINLRAQFPNGRIVQKRFFSSDSLSNVADTLELEDAAVMPLTSILHALPNGSRVVLDESFYDFSLAELGFTRDARVIAPLPAVPNDAFVAEARAAEAHFKQVVRRFARDQAAAERAAMEGRCEEIILRFEEGYDLKFKCLEDYTLGDLHDLACDELTARGVYGVYVRLFREPLHKGEYSLEDMKKSLGELRVPGLLHACIVTEEEQSDEEEVEEGVDKGFEGEVEGESKERDHGIGGETEEGEEAEVSCLGLVEACNPEMKPIDSPTSSMTVHFENGTRLSYQSFGDETLASLYEWIWERVTEREKSGNVDNLTLWRTAFHSDGLEGDSFGRPLRELALHGVLFACYDLHRAKATEEEARDGQGNQEERAEKSMSEETEEDVEKEEENEEEEQKEEEGDVIVTYVRSPIPMSVHCRGTETLSSLSDRILGLLRERHGAAALAPLEIYRPEEVEGGAEVFGEEDMEKSLHELGINLAFGTLFVSFNGGGGAATLAQKSPVEPDQTMQKMKEEGKEKSMDVAEERRESDAETVDVEETEEEGETVEEEETEEDGEGEEETVEEEETEEEGETVEEGETEEEGKTVEEEKTEEEGETVEEEETEEEGETVEEGETEEVEGEEYEDGDMPTIQVVFFNSEHSSRHLVFHHNPLDTLGSFYRRILARFRREQQPEVSELALFHEAYDEEQLGEEDMEKTLEELGVTHRGTLFAFYTGEQQKEEAQESLEEEEEEDEEEEEEEDNLDITIKFNNSFDPVEMGFDKNDTLSSVYEVALTAVQIFHLEVTELAFSRSPFFVPFAEGDMEKSLQELGVTTEIYAFFDIPNSA